MDLVALKNELTQDPLGIGYARLLENGTGLVPEVINSPNRMVLQDVWLNNRGLVAELVPVHGVAFTDSIFSKLDLAATQSATVNRMVKRLYTDSQGLNFGDAGLRAMFTSWRGKLLSAEEADALLGLGYKAGSRSQELFGQLLTESDITNALEL